MSYSRRPKAGRREKLTDTSVATSGVRDVESTEVVSKKTDTTVVDQAGTEITADWEMSISDAVGEDCDSDASQATNIRMQRGSGYPEKGLDAVAPFFERNPDKMASTLEWRETVLHSQEAMQATSYRQKRTAEERSRASLELKIELIRKRYREQEMVLEEEIVKHNRRRDLAMEQLEEEENQEEGYFTAECEGWEVQSDYQPTECGDDGSR